MNRQNRRKNGTKGKAKTYTLTDDQIRQLKKDATEEAIQTAFILMMGIPCLTLRDKFGFGSERLTRFMDTSMMWYESVQNGEVTLDEILKTIKEETGFDVVHDGFSSLFKMN